MLLAFLQPCAENVWFVLSEKLCEVSEAGGMRRITGGTCQCSMPVLHPSLRFSAPFRLLFFLSVIEKLVTFKNKVVMHSQLISLLNLWLTILRILCFISLFLHLIYQHYYYIVIFLIIIIIIVYACMYDLYDTRICYISLVTWFDLCKSTFCNIWLIYYKQEYMLIINN